MACTDQTCLRRCNCVRQWHPHSRSCRHTGKHGECKLQCPGRRMGGSRHYMCCKSFKCKHLALQLPILALHLPAIHLIPTVAAVVVTVAPPTGVQTLPVRTSVATRCHVRSKAGGLPEQVLIVAVVFLWTIVFIGHVGTVWEAVTKSFPIGRWIRLSEGVSTYRRTQRRWSLQVNSVSGLHICWPSPRPGVKEVWRYQMSRIIKA